ncbi:hypothetical protein P7C71_g1187, partial [Lecanoromycetidae sp. Uapishka_2]
MSTSAQDEFDALYTNNQGDRIIRHPEDKSDSDHSDNDSTTLHSDRNGDGDDDTLASNASANMPMATTYIPTNTQFDANTGPKGVIADARSFETARKRSFRQTLYAFSNTITGGDKEKKAAREKESKSPSPDLSDSEDDFMRTWRANRLEQLSNQKPGEIRTRRQSPSQRRYGSLVTVDPSGYLDAVEKVPSYTTVVVLIYDDESAVSNQVEDALRVLARNHPTVRFVRLHFLEAEMDEVAVPGILAYRGGDCFANLVSIIDEIPAGRDISTISLQSVLQQYELALPSIASAVANFDSGTKF